MRLTAHEVRVIKEAISLYDPGAKVYLFGSRVDDEKRGGDIDLLVDSGCIDLAKKIKILAKLNDELGEQKIDLLLKNQTKESFLARIFCEGILL